LNEEILLLNNEEEVNENENNVNEDNELSSEVKDESSMNKTDTVQHDNPIIDQEAETKNEDVMKSEEVNKISTSSLNKIKKCQSMKNIEASQNSVIKNKSVSVTFLAPLASISLDEKNNKSESNKNSNSASVDEITNQNKNKPVNEYSKEYIRQISCQRIDRYRTNNGLVRERIQRFKSNEEILKKPIKFSLSNNSLKNRDESSKSLKSITNDDDQSSSNKDNSISNKLKLNNSQSENPLFDSFRNNDDIIKEKITVLNMSAHMNTSQGNFSHLNDEKNIRENDLLENLELLRQGILGNVPINRKDKLIEFLTTLTDEHLDNYQKQIHEEFCKQQELNNIENKTIKLNKYYINFGYSKKKIPIEEEVQDTLVIESQGSNIKYSFDFVNKENNWLLDISPMSGVLSNTEVQEIKFSLTCKTTINKSIVIPLQLEDKNHFIVVRIRSQNSCFGVNIKNCDMEVDSIFKSNQYSIPKILKIYRELLIMNNAYQNGSNIFEDHQNKNEVTRIKKQVINNEPVVSIDIYSIAYLFKNWFYELPRKLLYQINQQSLLTNTDFDEYNDIITGLERVVFSWLIDCFVEMQNNLNDKDDIKNIVKSFAPGLYNIHYEKNTEKYNTSINNLELFINYSIDQRRKDLNL